MSTGSSVPPVRASAGSRAPPLVCSGFEADVSAGVSVDGDFAASVGSSFAGGDCGSCVNAMFGKARIPRTIVKAKKGASCTESGALIPVGASAATIFIIAPKTQS
jgi:hypothetical protein